ncbi:hypothetical protein ACP70R_048850 [Stipagrostis hirtigluma subsp. patula]
MEPSDYQSWNDSHSDESSGSPVRDVMEEVQEDPSSSQIDIDRAIDLMRFVFKEGLTLLENESEIPLHERMMVDMGGYLVNLMLEDPGVRQRNGPPRMRISTPTLENEIAHAFVKETRKGIANELQGDFFGIYVDVCSTSLTCKSYMVLFARYLSGKGEVVERLLGIVPYPALRDSAIKRVVDSMFSEAGLSWSNVRGQGHGLLGYDDEIFTELKTLIANENASGYHVHPYLCQLHSTLIFASYDQFEVYELFQIVDVLSNLVQDCPQFTEKVCTLIREGGVNLDNDLKKPGETRWGSYYEALVKFAAYFTPIVDALYHVEEVITVNDQRHLAYKILEGLCYDFAFALLLMQDVLSVTNELSLALDKKDLDAENCMALLQEAKKQLQVMRDGGWTPFLNKVGLFCSENEIPMPNMGAKFEPRLRRDKEAAKMTNLERYHVYFFEKVINIHLNELEKRFSKQSAALVLLSSCLNPRNSFQAFDKDKLVEFAQFYPSDFSDSDIVALDFQLQAFITDVRSDVRFREMNTMSALSVKMVETGKNAVYPLVYLLLKLALILPWTPATAKTASSAMKFIHRTVTIEPWNEWFSDCLLLYLERDIVENITNDAVIASL